MGALALVPLSRRPIQQVDRLLQLRDLEPLWKFLSAAFRNGLVPFAVETTLVQQTLL
jgi:hypothetical protein